MKYMCVAASTVIAWLAFRPFAFGTEPATKYNFEKTVNGQRIAVVLEIGPFDSHQHKVRHVSSNAGYLIDGQRSIGNDGATHATTEFKRCDIFWNGKKIKLDRNAWSSIFNVPLKAIDPLTQSGTGFAIIPSIDGSSILFYFGTGLADVGLEKAWLAVDRDGRWRKFHSWEAGD
jgi:hypothetical protein